MFAAPTRPLSLRELVPLLALLISLTAMAIDIMLPALGSIGRDLALPRANDAQLVLSALFLGLSLGQVAIGPISDSVGRRAAILGALAVFIAGSLTCLVSSSFAAILLGRTLQGIGAAGPRTVCLALVRDRYEGRAMARIMSTVMAVFVIVPALAPAIGQALLWVLPWRALFGFLLLQALVAGTWFALRQPETLAPERRLPLSPARIGRAMLETCRTRVAFGYTLAAGFVFGGFLGYLSSAQQIFQQVYAAGALFPLYFGGLAIALGAASMVNARVVMRLGMLPLVRRALAILTLLSAGFAIMVYAVGGVPPLPALIAYLVLAFLCVGILFGNLNALAMEPMGHIAGTAAAVIGSLSTLLSLGCGLVIGQAFDGSVRPLVLGFAVLAPAALVAVRWAAHAGARRAVAGQRAA